MRTKVRGPESLELALEMTKKERKKERLTNGYFWPSDNDDHYNTLLIK